MVDLSNTASPSPKPRRLIGQSSSLSDVLDHVSQVAPLNKPVLILGERGTGKELIADRLHFLSGRWQQPFLKLNCAAMNENLLESELFGHEAGAFTGATRRHKGRFERADGGTLFLDELTSSSSRVQEQLLRVIEYGEYERLGGHQSEKVDVRLIAAAQTDLEQLAASGEFRQDLLDRLAFDVIHLPPLRYRSEDIPLLAEHFAIGMCHELGREFFVGFSEAAMERLLNHPWPGNVRELKNVIERSVYKSRDIDTPIGDIVLDPLTSPWQAPPASPPPHSVTASPTARSTSPAHAPTAPLAPQSTTASSPTLRPGAFAEQVREYEIALIRSALQSCRYNQRETALRLGLTYHQLRGYLRKYRLTVQR